MLPQVLAGSSIYFRHRLLSGSAAGGAPRSELLGAADNGSRNAEEATDVTSLSSGMQVRRYVVACLHIGVQLRCMLVTASCTRWWFA